MTKMAKRTLWTGSGLAMGAAAFVSAFILLEGLPSRTDAASAQLTGCTLRGSLGAAGALVGHPRSSLNAKGCTFTGNKAHNLQVGAQAGHQGHQSRNRVIGVIRFVRGSFADNKAHNLQVGA